MSIPPPSDPQQPEDPYPAPQPQGPTAPPPGAAFPPPGPGGPYGAPSPYQPWTQGYTPLNRPPAINGVAIAALVLGVMCFLPAVGLILGVIALLQIRKRGERGKPMAITGAVLSTLGLALWIVSLSTGVASDAWAGFKEGFNGDSVMSLKKGECFDVPGTRSGIDEYVDEIDKVSCVGRHDAEVFAVVPMTGNAYPGDSRVWDIAEDKCWDLHTGYAMDPWALPEDVDVAYLTPSRDSWEAGDREITCTFAPEDDADTLTGSLRADETILSADQVAFLKAMRAVDDVLYAEPDDLAEDDLEINQDWSQDVRDVLAEQITALRGRTWASDAQEPVDALLKDMAEARDEWAKAAGAADVDTFYEHYDAGYGYVDGDTTVDVRDALDLATTPPSYDYGDPYEDGDGDGDEDPGSTGDGLDV